MKDLNDQSKTEISPQPTGEVLPSQSVPPKKNILILLAVLIIFTLVVGAAVFLINFKQKGSGLPTTEVSPSPAYQEDFSVQPTITEVSDSTEVDVLEKELTETDLGSFEKDLDQLDLEAGEL